MRLLVFNEYYRPRVEADGLLLAQLCESLAAEHEVTVVTGPAPGVPTGRRTEHGVEVVRVPATAFGRSRLSLRAANYASYLLASSVRGAVARRPDAVLSYTNPPFVGAAAALVARRFGAPYVLSCQDVFPETALALGELEGTAAGVLRRLVGLGLARADRVVAIGDTMKRRLIEKGVEPERVRVIPNWADTDALRPLEGENAWAREHGLEGRFVVMHSGNVGYAQDLDTLVRAAALLRDDVAVVVVGGGARLAELQELGRSLEAPVRFLPYQPPERLVESLSAASLHVVGLARGLAGLVVPSRIYGVLAVARPVVAAAEEESETAQLVRQADCGVVVPPGEPEALAAAIEAAQGGKYDLDAMGLRGREYVVREASRERAVERYRALLDELWS